MPGKYVIRSYQPGKIEINETLLTQSFVITPEALVYPWNKDDFRIFLQFSPEVIILGTGQAWQIIPPEKLSLFYEHKIGVEVMSSGAACRTFNVLASENRRVAAGIIP